MCVCVCVWFGLVWFGFFVQSQINLRGLSNAINTLAEEEY